VVITTTHSNQLKKDLSRITISKLPLLMDHSNYNIYMCVKPADTEDNFMEF